jgi:hypothetical protein
VLFALRARSASAPAMLTATLVLLTTGGPLAAARGLNALAPPSLVAHRPAWSVGLDASPVPARIYAEPLPFPPDATLAVAPRGWSVEWWWTLGVQDVMAAPIPSRWGIDGSYDGDTTGLTPRHVAELSVALTRVRTSPVSLPLLRAGGVDYVLALDARPWLIGPVRSQPSAFKRRILVYRVPGSLPRAFVVDGVRSIDGRNAGVLLDAGLDLRHEVLLEGVPARPHDPAFNGAAEVEKRRADAVSLVAEASAPGYLVLLDGYDEGWCAKVDGRPARVLRANLLFRAVALSAGRHRVELRYRPRSVTWGAALSALGWGLVVAFVLKR